MDLHLEQSLDTATSHEKQEEEVVQLEGDGEGEQTAVTIGSIQQAQAFADHNIQYQFRSEGGQVTYRVVQVTDQQLEGRDDGGGPVSVVSTAAFPGAPQAVAQAVIQNPFSNGGSPVGETLGGETRFAYFPATAVSDGTVSVQTTSDPTQAGGQFYVMMTPPDVLQTGTQRTIAPRTHPYPEDETEMLQHDGLNWKMDGPRTPRDERRRAQHNEVERRRRDKINNWIVTLSKIIPDCNIDSTKTGAVSHSSKGGILSKACDYIRELRQNNQRLLDNVKEVERVQVDNELCRQQVKQPRKNAIAKNRRPSLDPDRFVPSCQLLWSFSGTSLELARLHKQSWDQAIT
uniref:Upstream transcription factor 2, c-fos interacting n=1 Tax=Salmo trutta TaxID=8032 RepID=A0A674D0G6_SALTR